ncbi:hypothetical protein TNIN_318621 [Trichonephila inaurata madagascariensis]|uniref:Uncharacterized protein n=1 Tax=Trichonephila inaurata madagascariensis TaxID=2747483 RepID=A0A8X6XVA3_9ARAC|nr:hypothetical protein TNIN_318621 [Trichonephila inaurata madagascariensis]
MIDIYNSLRLNSNNHLFHSPFYKRFPVTCKELNEAGIEVEDLLLSSAYELLYDPNDFKLHWKYILARPLTCHLRSQSTYLTILAQGISFHVSEKSPKSSKILWNLKRLTLSTLFRINTEL